MRGQEHGEGGKLGMRNPSPPPYPPTYRKRSQRKQRIQAKDDKKAAACADVGGAPG